jgi:hypothetical protein
MIVKALFNIISVFVVFTHFHKHIIKDLIKVSNAACSYWGIDCRNEKDLIE